MLINYELSYSLPAGMPHDWLYADLQLHNYAIICAITAMFLILIITVHPHVVYQY